MSPEPARGKVVDKQADIWAFGVVLYEMLTGKPLSEGEPVSDVLAAVLTRDPDWVRLPDTTPPSVRRLLQRCLARDPRERLRGIADARLDLRDESPPVVEIPGGTRHHRLGWFAAVAFAGVAAVAGAAVASRL